MSSFDILHHQNRSRKTFEEKKKEIELQFFPFSGKTCEFLITKFRKNASRSQFPPFSGNQSEYHETISTSQLKSSIYHT